MGAGRWVALTAIAGLAMWGLAGARRVRARDLAGQVVVVTGGSRGLGLCIARELAGQGCKLVIVARDLVELVRASELLVSDGADVMPVRCDITQRHDVLAMVNAVLARHGRIDGLVNVAGIIQVGPLESMTLGDFEHSMSVNFYGPLHAVDAVVPGMRAQGSGWIVNIDSIGGRVSPPHLLPYNAAKFALRGYSEGLAAEVAKDGIEVITVLPGLMRTGSPLHALFKGRRAGEFTWFGIADSIPGLSLSAPDAARQVVAAVRLGKREVTLGLPAQLGGLVHDLWPGGTIAALELVNRLMPRYEGTPNEAHQGLNVKGRAVRPLQRAIADTGRPYNEVAPVPGSAAK